MQLLLVEDDRAISALLVDYLSAQGYDVRCRYDGLKLAEAAKNADLVLLGTPEFLILDEPINGLDPAGIAGVRTLLKTLNRAYGMTILISSHILEELYQTATDFILIDQGRIVETLSEQTLDARCKRHIAIRTNDPQRALLVLEEQLGSDRLRLLPDGTIHCYDHLDDVETVAQVLASAQVLVTGLEVRGETLEAYFLSRIGGGAHHV